jgi:hypothetical protein
LLVEPSGELFIEVFLELLTRRQTPQEHLSRRFSRVGSPLDERLQRFDEKTINGKDDETIPRHPQWYILFMLDQVVDGFEVSRLKSDSDDLYRPFPVRAIVFAKFKLSPLCSIYTWSNFQILYLLTSWARTLEKDEAVQMPPYGSGTGGFRHYVVGFVLLPPFFLDD